MLFPSLALIGVIFVWLLVREIKLQGNERWQSAYVIAAGLALVAVIGVFLNLFDNRVVDKRPNSDARMQEQNTISIGGNTVREEPKTTGSAP
jgi:hypothetical protein